MTTTYIIIAIVIMIGIQFIFPTALSSIMTGLTYGFGKAMFEAWAIRRKRIKEERAKNPRQPIFKRREPVASEPPVAVEDGKPLVERVSRYHRWQARREATEPRTPERLMFPSRGREGRSEEELKAQPPYTGPERRGQPSQEDTPPLVVTTVETGTEGEPVVKITANTETLWPGQDPVVPEERQRRVREFIRQRRGRRG